MHAALLQRGWRVSSAGTAVEALELYGAAPYPLVIVSHELPDSNGLALCRAIRGSAPGRSAYLVIIHPTAVPERVRAMAEAGIDDFVATPVAPSVLAMRLALAEYRLADHPGALDGDDRLGLNPERIVKLEHALRVREASLEELFQSAPEGIVVVTEDDRVGRMNDEFARMFGYMPQEALGRTVDELIVPLEQRSEAREVMRRAINGERVMVETVRRHRDGRLIEVSLLATPIRVGNGAVGAYGIYRDITERKAQERALAESEARYRARSAELEEAMQARSKLYTTMNHELRTPISAIMLYQELLLSGVMGGLAPEQTRALEDSHIAAQQLLELVNDILDLSKIEAGKIGLRPEPVQVGRVLTDLLATVLPLAHRFGSDVRLEIAEELPPLMTDPQRLRQILLNLASNAAKFGQGHPIVLRCRVVDEEMVIEVQDQGIGIADDELTRIFDDFVQVGTLQHGGTGLGLAISKRLATLLHGRLEVESALGEGSLFRLVLPARLGTTLGAAEAAMVN
ncbi:MAG: PAS domain S-box protein [Gemmatimonadetes bacterium]|nr:PAS domain S-box protein [Gemmatimonadota bacterium]